MVERVFETVNHQGSDESRLLTKARGDAWPWRVLDAAISARHCQIGEGSLVVERKDGGEGRRETRFSQKKKKGKKYEKQKRSREKKKKGRKDEKETTTMERMEKRRRRGKKKRKRNEIRFAFGGFGHSLRRAVSQLWQIDRGCLVRYITIQSTSID